MDTKQFLGAYSESRNGCNFFVRHPLVPVFQYSDGVKDCAEAGMYWLLDIIATECLKPLRLSGDQQSLVNVAVKNGKCVIALSIEDDAPPLWKRKVAYTDLPDGEYIFELVDEGSRFAMILITEH